MNQANKVISTIHATDYEPGEAKGDCVEGEEDNERVQISRGSWPGVELQLDYMLTTAGCGRRSASKFIDDREKTMDLYWRGHVVLKKPGKEKGEVVCRTWYVCRNEKGVIGYSKLNKSGYLRIPSTCP